MKLRLTAIIGVIGIYLVSFAGVAEIEDFVPATDEVLRNPNPEDWVMWRRTYDSVGHSPLDQINRGNVGGMQLAWAYSLRPGDSQPEPLVYNGVMYIVHPGDVITALDAATGDFIWEYERDLPDDARARQSRSISIYEDKVIHATSDAHIIALDARDGRLVWESVVADYTQGYGYTSGPLVADGAVIAGMGGCTGLYEESCFITAHDVETGEELWRTFTIARPGEYGGDTWGDLPFFARGGGDAWITGSYDPELRLVYWGIQQAKPWARVTRGTDGDALYTDSTVALDIDTGEIVWYHQYQPGETLDIEEPFEPILIDVDGRMSLYNMGKLGILWNIDRETGEFVNHFDLGYQDVIEQVDPQTGRTTYRPDAIPEVGVEVEVCPHVAGFKSWRAMSYNSAMDAFYIPLRLACGTFITEDTIDFVEGGGGVGAPWSAFEVFYHPDSEESIGEFIAMDRATGEVLWRQRQRAPFHTSALSTDGDLVFVGDWARFFNAYDSETGELLWRTRLSSSPHGSPITYGTDGKQYVAVPVGYGWIWAQGMESLAPEVTPPPDGNAIYVFALPDSE